jgi:hypothetical protein
MSVCLGLADGSVANAFKVPRLKPTTTPEPGGNFLLIALGVKYHVVSPDVVQQNGCVPCTRLTDNYCARGARLFDTPGGERQLRAQLDKVGKAH